jgi:hypothetical protein
VEFGVIHEIEHPQAWQKACDADPQESPDFHLAVWVGLWTRVEPFVSRKRRA